MTQNPAPAFPIAQPFFLARPHGIIAPGSIATHIRRAAPPLLQLLAGPLASLLVSLMGLALSVTGFVLLLALEHMPDTASRYGGRRSPRPRCRERANNQ